MDINIDNELAAIRQEKATMLEKVAPLKEQMAELEEQMRELMDPHVARIQDHEENIRNATLMLEKSFKGEHGKVTYRKEHVRTSWDTKALEGYAAAGHDEILQFKKESVVKPNVSIKVEEVE
jgi:hypothetical protein